MAKLSSIDKLKLMSESCHRSRAWYDRISKPCLQFITEAAELFISGKSNIRSQDLLYKLISEVVAADYPDDIDIWPPRRTFSSWFLLLRESGTLSKEKTLNPPVNTKKQAASKRKTV